MPLSMDLNIARREGLLLDLDPFPAYFAHIRTLVDLPAIAASGIKIAVDAMYGAGISIPTTCCAKWASIPSPSTTR